MIKRVPILVLMVAITIWAGSCARDVNFGNPDANKEPYPNEVKIVVQMLEELSSEVWYYFAFNFSHAAASVQAADRPLDIISDEDRAKNWELYIMYHKDSETGELLKTFQRPRLPSLVLTGAGPRHSAIGNFNGDTMTRSGTELPIKDIALACRSDDIVEIIYGINTDAYEPSYFESSEAVPATAGSAPIRVFAGPHAGLRIIGVNVDDRQFTVEGDQTGYLSGINSLVLSGSTSDPTNNGTYSITGSPSVSGGNTTFTVSGAINSDVPSGHFSRTGIDDLLVVYAGDGVSGPFARMLAGDNEGGFTARADQPLTGEILDAFFDDFTGDGTPDLAVLSDGSAAERGLRIYAGDGAGGFSVHTELTVDSDPVAMAYGVLRDDTANNNDLPDFAVAHGGDGATGTITMYLGDDLGAYDDEVEITTAREYTGIAIGKCIGTRNDVIASYGATGNDRSVIGAFDVENDDAAAQGISVNLEPDEFALSASAYNLTAMDTDADSYDDILILDGKPGATLDDEYASGRNLFIIRSGPPRNITAEEKTVWEDKEIVYLTGSGPTRITTADIDSNGVPDLLIPNSGLDDDANSICLFYGLGKTNYTNSDIYWTDDPPEDLVAQDWYLEHIIARNYIELKIDPSLFYDLTDYETEGFIVDFMTGTTGLNYEYNMDHEGVIEDNLLEPVYVPMTIGLEKDEQTSNLTREDPTPLEAQDIMNWLIQVN